MILPHKSRHSSLQPAANNCRYAELHCRSNYSFLEGASHPEELIQRAAELDYEALAITDRNSLAGIVRAHIAAKEVGLKLLIGAEITPTDAPPLVLLATDRTSYGRLSRLITSGRRRAPKGECQICFDDLSVNARGLLACVPLKQLDASKTERSLRCYSDLFEDRCYGLAELHLGSNDPRQLEEMFRIAKDAAVPVAAANDVHYHEPRRQFLQDVLTAIRLRSTVAELGAEIFPNAERYLKAPAQLAELFGDYPEVVSRTVEVAQRCSFSLDELRYQYPKELCPPGMTPYQHLTRLAWEGARRRYRDGVPEKVCKLIEHELALIKELRYEAYFLTVWDLVRFARQRGILCQGRGSAANSAVCYCLNVTSVDPDRIDVLFERFVSRERDEAPDIDVDFEHERREEVIQYIFDKYGRDRAGMTAEVIRYRPRSAIRDVGKALGLSLDRVDALANAVGHCTDCKQLGRSFQEAGLDPESRTGRQLSVLFLQILSFPRHLSQHVGGMIITQGPLCEYVPIENAAMPERTVVQWDKNDLDALGILKVDCLALGMLTAIRKGFELIKQHYGTVLTLATVPAEDPEVYKMIQHADTIGVFQIESRAQMSMLPRLKPRCFYDLVIEVAIVRPGPIQGGMVHPYLRRRCGDEAVEYPSAEVKSVLEKTLGVPIFQEQAMRLAVVAAGFTPGEADQLRRAMGAWRRPGIIDQFREKLIAGMRAKGYSEEFSDRLFRQIQGFGDYGFPESHAASFALLVYVSAWIKRYYPGAFTAAVLNSQPMGFYAPAQLVADLRRHRVEVRPVDINRSHLDCTLEPVHSNNHAGNNPDNANGSLALRLGFRMVKGLSSNHANVIVQQRGKVHFDSFDDFARRTRLNNSVLLRLSRADAFGSILPNRRVSLWQSLPKPALGRLLDKSDCQEPVARLPVMSPQEEVVADYQNVGLSLRGHPVEFIRSFLKKNRVTPASDLANIPNGRQVKVAGLVLMRQRPSTAKGVTFVTLEDETGVANLIVRPEVWQKYDRIARSASALVAQGKLQNAEQVIHVLATTLIDLSTLLEDAEVKSRDFR